VSVSVDPPDSHQAALEFLKKASAAFANFRLDEEQEFWQAKFQLLSPPAMFVFDRLGRRAGKFDNDSDKPYTHKDVEKLVTELLRSPP
jgi:hypothetical protein